MTSSALTLARPYLAPVPVREVRLLHAPLPSHEELAVAHPRLWRGPIASRANSLPRCGLPHLASAPLPELCRFTRRRAAWTLRPSQTRRLARPVFATSYAWPRGVQRPCA